MSLEAGLIAFAAVAAAVAAGLGYRFHESHLWHWVDVVYYPAGIVGVILLFASTERTRTLLNLDLQRIGSQQKLEAITSTRPRRTLDPFAPNLLPAYRDTLRIIIETGRDACRLP